MSNPIEHRRGMFNRPEFDELSEKLNDIILRTVPSTSDLTYHVSPTGNDNNNGLTASSPLKTINAALAKIPTNISSAITVQLAPGTYTEYISDNRNFVLDPAFPKARLNIYGSFNDYVPTVGPASGTFAASFGTQRIPNIAVVTGATWAIDELKGKFVRVLSGSRTGLSIPIANNTADTLTLSVSANTGTYNLQNQQFKIVETAVTIQHPLSANGTAYAVDLSGTCASTSSGSAISSLPVESFGYVFYGINFSSSAQNNILRINNQTVRVESCSFNNVSNLSSPNYSVFCSSASSANLYYCYLTATTSSIGRLYAVNTTDNVNSFFNGTACDGHYYAFVAGGSSSISTSLTLCQNQQGYGWFALGRATIGSTASASILNASFRAVSISDGCLVRLGGSLGGVHILDSAVGIYLGNSVILSLQTANPLVIDGCNEGIHIEGNNSNLHFSANLQIKNSTTWGVRIASSGVFYKPTYSGLSYISATTAMSGNTSGDFTLDGTTPISLANVEAAPNKLVTDAFGNYIRGT